MPHVIIDLLTEPHMGEVGRRPTPNQQTHTPLNLEIWKNDSPICMLEQWNFPLAQQYNTGMIYRLLGPGPTI